MLRFFSLEWWRGNLPPSLRAPAPLAEWSPAKAKTDLQRAQDAVDQAKCPKCGSGLCEGPCGGAAMNVVCQDDACGWKVNTLPLGNCYVVVHLISPMPPPT